MTVCDLEILAERAASDLDEADAADVLRWADETFGSRLCVTSSMADSVLAHLASRVIPGIDVVFLDTGYHFPETLRTRDAVAAAYDLNLVTVRPQLTVVEQDGVHGRNLFASDPDRCCAMRKVAPLEQALEGYDAWATGLRRDDGPTRASTQVVEWDERRRKVKVNPLAAWSQADVDRYVERHGVIVNPLQEQGYPSIGCAPCTRRVRPGEDARAGRWSELGKTECGLHR